MRAFLLVVALESAEPAFAAVPVRDVAGRGPVVYEFFRNQKLTLTVPQDLTTLEIRP